MIDPEIDHIKINRQSTNYPHDTCRMSFSPELPREKILIAGTEPITIILFTLAYEKIDTYILITSLDGNKCSGYRLERFQRKDNE
jgi:hypothetical protein